MKKLIIMTPSEYINYVEPYYMNQLPLTIEELIDMTEWDDERYEFGFIGKWNYPINEIDYCDKNNINVVLVYYGDESRLFEV